MTTPVSEPRTTRDATAQEVTLGPLAQVTSRSDLVAGAIREAILEGRLVPGQTLVERRLAELLGVSKTPVREALIGLAATGLVRMNLNRGVTVRQLVPDDVRKIYEVRILLEPWAVGRAARQANPEAVRVAHDALEEAGGLLGGADDHVPLSLVNRRFHRALYSCCDNDLITDRLDELQDLTALAVVSLLWKRSPTWVEEFREHQRILEAVEAGDAGTAERLAREHVEHSLTRLGRTTG